MAATFAHDEAGVSALCRSLVKAKVGLVAIERPDGLLIERLLDGDLRVTAIYPNQVHAARPRFRAAGGKADRFHAFVLCELVAPTATASACSCPTAMRPRRCARSAAHVRTLVQTRVALANQLRAELERFWPGAIEIFSDVDSLTAWRS